MNEAIGKRDARKYTLAPDGVESLPDDDALLRVLGNVAADDAVLRAVLTLLRKEREAATLQVAMGRGESCGEYDSREQATGGMYALMLAEQRIYQAWNDAHKPAKALPKGKS